MKSNLKEALTIFGFERLDKIPKVKDIRRRFMKLSLLNHHDKNNSSSEANSRFQDILKAYETAGEVLKDTVYEDDNQEDEIAMKMFKQFFFSSVKENASSFTILTEKSLYPIWCEMLCWSCD